MSDVPDILAVKDTLEEQDLLQMASLYALENMPVYKTFMATLRIRNDITEDT